MSYVLLRVLFVQLWYVIYLRRYVLLHNHTILEIHNKLCTFMIHGMYLMLHVASDFSEVRMSDKFTDTGDLQQVQCPAVSEGGD